MFQLKPHAHSLFHMMFTVYAFITGIKSLSGIGQFTDCRYRYWDWKSWLGASLFETIAQCWCFHVPCYEYLIHSFIQVGVWTALLVQTRGFNPCEQTLTRWLVNILQLSLQAHCSHHIRLKDPDKLPASVARPCVWLYGTWLLLWNLPFPEKN